MHRLHLAPLALLFLVACADDNDIDPAGVDVGGDTVFEPDGGADSESPGDAAVDAPDGAEVDAPDGPEVDVPDDTLADSGDADVAEDTDGCRPETCNGEDDDCDGETDEDFDLGAACRAGLGVCMADGVTICGAEGDAVCDAVPGTPGAELCNGEDDDCDGSTDEDFDLGRVCDSEGRGACVTQGQLVCRGDEAACDAVPDAPRAEVCDGADNDCNGRIDDGVCQSRLTATPTEIDYGSVPDQALIERRVTVRNNGDAPTGRILIRVEAETVDQFGNAACFGAHESFFPPVAAGGLDSVRIDAVRLGGASCAGPQEGQLIFRDEVARQDVATVDLSATFR